MARSPETSLVSVILDYLALRGIPSWRNNSGATRIGRRFIRFGRPGSPDILGILPPSGRLLGVEAKVRPNKPTQAQQAWLDMASQAGALVVVAYSLDDVVSVLDAHYHPT